MNIVGSKALLRLLDVAWEKPIIQRSDNGICDLINTGDVLDVYGAHSRQSKDVAPHKAWGP